MTIPALVFGILLAALFAALFHFWRGDTLIKLLLFIIFSEAGFWAGHLLGAKLGWTFAKVGPLNVGMGILGSLVFLLIGRWLSLVEIKQK